MIDKERFGSRKFWFALVGALLPVLASFMSAGISLEDALKLATAIIISYVLGQGYVDAQREKAKIQETIKVVENPPAQ